MSAYGWKRPVLWPVGRTAGLGSKPSEKYVTYWPFTCAWCTVHYTGTHQHNIIAVRELLYSAVRNLDWSCIYLKADEVWVHYDQSVFSIYSKSNVDAELLKWICVERCSPIITTTSLPWEILFIRWLNAKEEVIVDSCDWWFTFRYCTVASTGRQLSLNVTDYNLNEAAGQMFPLHKCFLL